jgi:type I restriction enzyme M protein
MRIYSNSNYKKLISEIELLGRRFDYSQVFSDFLTATINFFTPPYHQAHDLSTFNKYSDQERLSFGRFIQLLIKIHDDLLVGDDDWIDVLGTVYEDINSKRKSSALGQFFTPPEVCDMMTKMSYTSEAKGLNILDPTCGSGRTLISFHVANPGNYVYGQDIDLICCKMSVINLMLSGAVGEIVHCNALLIDDFMHGWSINQNLSKFGLPSIKPVTKEQSKLLVMVKNTLSDNQNKRDISKANVKITHKPNSSVQLSLF